MRIINGSMKCHFFIMMLLCEIAFCQDEFCGSGLCPCGTVGSFPYYYYVNCNDKGLDTFPNFHTDTKAITQILLFVNNNFSVIETRDLHPMDWIILELIDLQRNPRVNCSRLRLIQKLFVDYRLSKNNTKQFELIAPNRCLSEESTPLTPTFSDLQNETSLVSRSTAPPTQTMGLHSYPTSNQPTGARNESQSTPNASPETSKIIITTVSVVLIFISFSILDVL